MSDWGRGCPYRTERERNTGKAGKLFLKNIS
jgi:hypothetical protein